PRPAQIHQRGLRLQPGQPCTLRLTLNATDTPAAPAPPTQTLTLGIKDARPPWRIHFSTPVTLSATKTTVTEASFLYEAEPDAELRFNLQDLPANATGITLQSASLRQGGTAGSPPPRLASAPHTFDYPRKRTFKTLSIPAQRDWLRFLWQTEERYWLAMRDYLRHDLGVRSLLIGTQLGAYSIFPIQQQLDALDIHAYWQHPEFHGDRNDRNNWTVGNKSMVSDPSGAYASYPSLYRVAGKPYLLTEYNHPSPNTYGAEAFPIISAYAAFQDWDAIFAYSWAHGVISWDAGYQTGNFDIDQNPVKLVTLPLAAALFRRGDVDTPGPAHLKTIPVAPDAALDSLRRSGTRLAADLFGGSRHEALRIPYAVRLARPGEAGAHPAPTRAPAYAWTGPITTRGGALTWDAAPDAGLFTIRTPRTKAAIGFTRSRAHDLGGLVIRPAPNRQDWATIALTQTLGPRIGAPGRALLIACGDMENTGQIWKNASKNNVTDWGHAPTLVEGIPADITLALVAPATTLTVWALDARGQRATPVPATITGNTAHFSIGPAYKTLWYEIHTR
ncbi:MAG: hypothetical protein LBK99_22020, partial [Opitutaceae bacterium]|nr:hypothetical protein [Opitutaceae bacterium]